MSQSTSNPLITIKEALKLIHSAEDDVKLNGLEMLDQVMADGHKQIFENGYDLVIMKELIRIAQFETGSCFALTLDVLKKHYFPQDKHWDELAEMLILKFARSTDPFVCKHTLEKMSSLIDHFDSRIAKHSKQIMKLADLNEITDLNPVMIQILEKMKPKLPVRKEM